MDFGRLGSLLAMDHKHWILFGETLLWLPRLCIHGHGKVENCQQHQDWWDEEAAKVVAMGLQGMELPGTGRLTPGSISCSYYL